MATIAPSVRLMVLCDDVQPSRGNPRKVNVFGVLHRIVAKQFPARHMFTVYLTATGGRGTGLANIVVIEADSLDPVHTGDVNVIDFEVDPLQVHAFAIRIPLCEFPRSGLSWVQFQFDGVPLMSQPLLLEQE